MSKSNYIMSISPFNILTMYKGHITLFFYDLCGVIRAAFPECVRAEHIGMEVDQEMIDWVENHFRTMGPIMEDLLDEDLEHSKEELLCL